MAGKISDLATLLGTDAADTDDFEIRDISAGATGTNKRITIGDFRVALKTQTIVNVKNFGADGTYNPALPASDPGNVANFNTNNTAFSNAWSAARTAGGMLFIPVGIYGLNAGILWTSTNDAGIWGESHGNTILHFIDSGGTGTCVRQSITDANYWSNAARIALPPIFGFTIDMTDCGVGTIGLRVGPAHSGFWEVRIREGKGSGGANTVAGMTGAIGMLMQNDVNFPNYFCESNVIGPRTSIQNCRHGLVVDRNGGHQSFGYNHIPFLHMRNNIEHHLAIMNGAYLYAGSFDLEMVTTLPQTIAGITLDGGNSRLSGNLDLAYEINHTGAVVTLANIPDVTSLWRTTGSVDILTSCYVLPTNNVPNPGSFHHDGMLAMSPTPPGVVGWHCHSVFDPSTNLVTRVSGASNTASVFTVYGDFSQTFQKGTRVAWCESSVIKYGVCSTNATFASGTSKTTVTLAPNTDYWMAASPDIGSLRYAIGDPPDFPGWFNFTPTFTGYSALPSVAASMPYTGVTITTATDLFTKTAHGLVNGDTVTLSNISGSTVPGGTTTLFYVIASTANTFQLSQTSGGATIDCTGANGSCTVNAAGPPTQTAYKYRIDGITMFYILRDGINGNSNATTMAVSLPVVCAANSFTAITPMRVVDNSVIQTAPGSASVSPLGSNVNIGKTYDAAGNFTATGGKRVSGGEIRYII